ncbi:MAG TPA: hypothetical protein VJL37_10100 [Flavobacterium sp.]|nr:hypothetical protein [Flavobacterium sp.]
MEQEKWIEMVLNSSDNVKKVTPDEGLFLKIQQNINENPVVSFKTMWFAAASILVFFSINILLLNVSKVKQENQMSVLAQEIDKDNQLYQ